MRISNQSGAGGAHVDILGRPLIMMGPEDGGGSGGGAGDGTGGGGTEDSLPKTKRELTELIAQSINSAISNRAERDQKKRAKEIGDAVSAALQSSGLVKKVEGEEGTEEGGAGGSGGGGTPDKKNPKNELEMQLYRMAKEVEAQKKAFEEEKGKREKAERKSALDEEMSKLRASLADKVKPELLEAAVRLTSERIVRDPETMDIMWKSDKWTDREGADNLDNYESFDLGLQKWADGIGKHFAPPKPVGGAGTGRPGSDGRIKGADGVASDEDIGSILTTARR